uniref:Uncharacterized protein n=1 Tax=Arundo donax TaxID=35708 RepID=A0A0A8Y8B2_ARUDO
MEFGRNHKFTHLHVFFCSNDCEHNHHREVSIPS